MKKQLQNVTLLGIDCVDIDRLIRAANICMESFDFKEVKLLTSISCDNLNIIKINPLLSREEYSQFIIKNLNDYVDTEFVLIIQYDGFILNPKAWTDDFLKYDHIGAPWWYDDNHNVGNGGFSLRSKKLLEILATDPHIEKFHPEDHYICRVYRDYLEGKGIRFATEEVACRFSVETFKEPKSGLPNSWIDQLGFHGYYTDISKWFEHHPEFKEIMTATFEERKITHQKEREQERLVVRETENGKTFSKKAKDGEILMYKEVLDIFAPIYNPKFSLLELPIALSFEETLPEPILTVPFYEGEIFNAKWDESSGGSLLGLDLSLEFPKIIHDLSLINIEPILENQKLKTISKFSFNHQGYLKEFEEVTKPFLKENILNEQEVEKARNLLKENYSSKMILNNGDFYPRNLIRTPSGKIVLVDWETWNANSRANVIDYIENVAAFCFVHMWNNPAWQKNYVQNLKKICIISLPDLRKGILIKSLEMARFWFKENGQNELSKNQVRIFKDALDDSYMDMLWN